MFDSFTPLSQNDFDSGRFLLLAEFVRKNWPFGNAPDEIESLNIVAKTLGYMGYEDALSKATSIPNSTSSIFYDPVINFLKLEIEGSSERIAVPRKDDSYFGMFAAPYTTPAKTFVDSWPINLVGRWNYEKRGCEFSKDFLDRIEGDFEKIWSNSSLSSNGFLSQLSNTNSAASYVINETSKKSMNELKSFSIEDVLDEGICEALLQDAAPKLINELLTVSDYSAEILIKETGMSMRDIWELPKSEDGFPSLYQHMRNYLITKLIKRSVMTLFITQREECGFYHPPHAYDDMDEKKIDYPEPLNYIFNQRRDFMEENIFRSYSWESEVRSNTGDVLVSAVGSYIHGPSNKATSGFDLISALDEVGDYDVEIADMIQGVLQEEICEEEGEWVEKGHLNMQLIFRYGSLVTVTHWERSEYAEAGLGVELLEYTIDMLKKRFKRNMHVAAIIDAYQYKEDGQLHPAVSEQRLRDIKKISNTLSKLDRHPNVLRMFMRPSRIEVGMSAFTRHLTDAYGREQ